MNIAIIPARGGSKRIPRKNIKNFCGQPIIAYSIQAAQKSNIFDRIIVSTDDEEIANVSRQYGAEVPFFRPTNLADDHTGTSAVVKHAINWLRDNDIPVEIICCLYATAPLIQTKFLRKGYERLLVSDKKYAFSVSSFSFPIQRAVRIRPDGALEAFYPECIPMRSQDLEEAFHDAGQFYWGRTQAFLEGIPLFSPAAVPVVLPRYLVQDIDTLEDWKRAELMYRVLQEEKSCG
ncbi:MAG: pseudaminic acid cytidylyltransferase [Bacteroidia bacterium]|nr:pseudaminic acid cytidylyltransferase [Bacteroidia bacterium]